MDSESESESVELAVATGLDRLKVKSSSLAANSETLTSPRDSPTRVKMANKPLQ